MTRTIHGITGRQVYPEVVRFVAANGQWRTARGLRSLDVEDVTIRLDSPYDALPVRCGRNLSRGIAAAEALQLIGGFSDPEWLVKISPEFQKFREPDGEFWGSYGNRVGYQLTDAVSKLRDDPDTRQAVISLWVPSLDNFPGKKDYPCTVAIGLSVVNRRVNARVVMRSNDAWLGLPYDLFQFTQLQLSVCHALDLDPGTYTHTAWSLHLYEQHIDRAYGLRLDPDTEFTPLGIGDWSMDIGAITNRARDIHTGNHSQWFVKMTRSEEWYRDAVGAAVVD